MFEALKLRKLNEINPEYCLSLDEILEYLDRCTTQMFDILNPEQQFCPYARAVVMVTNPDYDPKGFSEEIEASELDKTSDELKYMCEHHLCGWEYPDANSETWKTNHHKKGWISLTYGQFLTAMQTTREFKWKNGNEEYEVSVKNRTFGSTENHNRITEWFNDLKSKGIHVYEFSI